jgi:hypothetical protein
MPSRNGSLLGASIWMFVLSLLLFWLPVVGPLIAGFVGGRKAGDLGNAVLAVFLPGILFGVVLFFLSTLFMGLPLLGLVAGAGGLMLALAHVGPLLLGAILGALL